MALAETLRTGDHLHDHLALHSMAGLATDVEVGDSGHPDAHEALHSFAGLPLPTDITPGSPGHDEAHRQLHEWWNAEFATFVGPRGIVGPTDPANISNFPQSGMTTVSPGTDTIQAAITAGSNNQKFLLEAGTYNITSRIEPKLGQEFWGEQGVTIQKSSGSHTHCFWAGSGISGVKVMNVSILGDGLTDGLIYSGRGNSSSFGHNLLWEVGYCELDGEDHTRFLCTVYHVHHTQMQNWRIAADSRQDFGLIGSADGGITEDCDFGPQISGASDGNKWLGCWNTISRHNRYHNVVHGIGGHWPDFGNFDDTFEWNIYEDNGVLGGTTLDGAFFEANSILGNGNGTETSYPPSNTSTQWAYVPFHNKVRYNVFQNNMGFGSRLAGTPNTETHDNIYENNQEQNAWAEYGLDLSKADQDGEQHRRMENTYFHHNLVIATNAATSVHAVTGFGRLQPGSGWPETTADYRDTNTKMNVWNFNDYRVPSALANDSSPFAYWFNNSGNTPNKTWTTWRQVPVPSGTLLGHTINQGTQDAHSTLTAI